MVNQTQTRIKLKRPLIVLQFMARNKAILG